MMKIKNYLITNKQNESIGVLSLYRKIKFNKLTKLNILEKSMIINMLKKEQFNNLDNLINDTLERLENLIRYSENNIEKVKLQNKFSGLQDLKRKIYSAKNEYLKNPNNKLLYNKLINLYNSSKNFL